MKKWALKSLVLVFVNMACGSVDKQFLDRATQLLAGGISAGKRAYLLELLVAYQAHPEDMGLYSELGRALGESEESMKARIAAMLIERSTALKSPPIAPPVEEVLDEAIQEMNSLRDLVAQQAALIEKLQQAQEIVSKESRDDSDNDKNDAVTMSQRPRRRAIR